MSLRMHTPDSGHGHHHSVSYDGKIAGLYDLEETLGSGHFAVVKLARHVFTGEKVAVKVVDKTKLDEVSKAHLFQEVRCMKLVQHPNVVRLYEVIDTQTKLYLILELGDGGDLYDYIMKHEGGLPEDVARKYFRQIVRAISYCHQLHVVHRDLKPANVVFFEKAGVVKLTDFGFSNKFLPGQKLETSCGSLAYSAPEILLGDSYDAQAVDIWSLGVILYMLVCGEPPFEKANDSETLTMIMDCKYSMPSHVTVTCRRLIASMLVRDPEKRATLEHIAQDVWLKQNSTGAEPLLDHLPLVSQEQVSEDDHAFIIQKMINGNIASKEDIMQSLDRNKYNHITATYYLLAERRLRQMREQALKNRPVLYPASPGRLTPGSRSNVPEDNKLKTDQNNKLSVPVNIEMCNSIEFTTEAVTEKRNRKCSIVREEEEEDSCECPDKFDLMVTGNRRASISDGRMKRPSQDHSAGVVSGGAVGGGGGLESQYMSKLVIKPIASHESSRNSYRVGIEKWDNSRLDQQTINTDANKMSQDPNMPKKSPAKNDCIKQSKAIHHTTNTLPINEQHEAGGTEGDNLSELQHDLSGIKDLEISKMRNKNPVLMHRRTKLNKMRTPSCSSSEASDDETKSKKKKVHKIGGDTPNRFRMNRRDSYDDSSDSQDQANFGSCGQTNANIVLSNNSKDEKSTSGNKKEEQSNKGGGGGSGGGGEPQNSHSKQKKGCSLMENCLPKVGGRRRLRESQSLDRITESQEYEHRHNHNHHHRYSTNLSNCNNHNDNSAIHTQFQNMSLNYNSVPEQTWSVEKTNCTSGSTGDGAGKTSSHESNSGTLKNKCDMNSVDEIDLYIGMNVTKAIHSTGSKYSVTMKKIRRLGKYFPVINLS